MVYLWKSSSLYYPAIINIDGDLYWFKHGLRHRDDNEPAIMRKNGYHEWFIDDELYGTQNISQKSIKLYYDSLNFLYNKFPYLLDRNYS